MSLGCCQKVHSIDFGTHAIDATIERRCADVDWPNRHPEHVNYLDARGPPKFRNQTVREHARARHAIVHSAAADPQFPVWAARYL